MKRATKKWVGTWLDSLVEHHKSDILDSDARQRAEIRRLKKELGRVFQLAERLCGIKAEALAVDPAKR
jgi:hypothetical protein